MSQTTVIFEVSGPTEVVDATVGHDATAESNTTIVSEADMTKAEALYEAVELMFATHHRLELNYERMSKIAEALGKSISSTVFKERLRESRAGGQKIRKDIDNSGNGSEVLGPLKKRKAPSLGDEH